MLLRLGQLDEAISALHDARMHRLDQDPSVDDYVLAIAYAKKERYLEAAKIGVAVFDITLSTVQVMSTHGPLFTNPLGSCCVV